MAFVAVVGWLLLPGVVSAHPHGWVDLRVRVVFDDQGRVEALRQSWRMDPFYSLVVLEGLGSLDDGSSMAERLDQLGAEIRANLEGQHFFTELIHGGAALALGEVTEYTTLIVGKRLEFSFVLPLAEPLALNGTPLRYKIFDPSYYIEVVHKAEDGAPSPAALSLSDAPNHCDTQIVMADPDPAKVMQAAMLDRDESGEDGLGRFFAETGVVACES
ncbi:MAG TPA: DUF1007 family protein [Modicisalibacter sp.]|nr:DUF1007 family protein [Modicisalibacter sp.]